MSSFTYLLIFLHTYTHTHTYAQTASPLFNISYFHQQLWLFYSKFPTFISFWLTEAVMKIPLDTFIHGTNANKDNKRVFLHPPGHQKPLVLITVGNVSCRFLFSWKKQPTNGHPALKKEKNHLLHPGGIKHCMNHADAAESRVTPTIGGACLWGVFCSRACVCVSGRWSTSSISVLSSSYNDS